MSISASPRAKQSCLAVATYTLPGPTILSTRGTLCVPYAMAAIACAPPSLTIWEIPAIFAAARMTAGTLPAASGGVHRKIFDTPAILAGIAAISTELG